MLELPLETPLSSGVDWFSGSIAVPESRVNARQVWAIVREKLEAAGRKTTLTTWKGYELQANGSFRYGIREADDYVEIQTEPANQWWLYFYPYVSHVARIDVQATWRPPKPIPGLARSVCDRTRKLPDRGPSPPILEMHESWPGGQTFYLGSPKSDRRGRIYDKGVQLGVLQPGELWRYEVQYRNAPAQVVAKHAANALRRGSLLASLVATHYKQRHVAVPWAEGLDDVPVAVHRPASTHESLKAWMIETVRPVCRRLTPVVGPSEVFAWLNLR